MGKSKKPISDKFNQPFAARIRALMDENGTTQDELSKAIDRTRQTVSQYVNGISEPGYDTLVRIADYFKVSTDFLLGRSKTRTSDATLQAVIEYTGLSESNAGKLHEIAVRVSDQISAKAKNGDILLNGNKPFLDCLNDILDYLYSDGEAIMSNYVRLRRNTLKEESSDLWYLIGTDTTIPPLEPNRYTDYKIQFKHDNELVEYDCIKIASFVEKGLLKKYLATQEEIDALIQKLDTLHSLGKKTQEATNGND